MVIIERSGLSIKNVKMNDGGGPGIFLDDVPAELTDIEMTDMTGPGVLITAERGIEPVLQMVNYDAADDLVSDEGAQWLDVRLNIEYLRDSIPDSMNIPLNKLRANLHKLSSGQKYIVYCDTGRRSESAAFILNEHGLDAIVLEDGLEGL